MKSEETTADRRKREAAQGPVILYGMPSLGEIAQARGAGRGVLVLPEEMRDSLIASGGGWPPTDQPEHEHYSQEARERCAAGDHEAAELFDKQDRELKEREVATAAKIREHAHPGFEDDGLVSSEWMGDSLVGVSNMADKVYDQEPHDHYTQRATRLCAEGDHDSAELWDRDAERVKVREAEAAEQDRIAREDGVVDITRHSEDTLFKVREALEDNDITPEFATALISAIQNAGILFREPAPDYDAVPESEVPEWREREKMFESREATLDLLWKRGVIDEQRHHRLRQQLREEFGYDQGEPAEDPYWAERAAETVTIAEEPIENRLRRAWLNGFRDGVDRASFAATESTGRWDY